MARQGSLDSLLPTELAYPAEVFLHRVVNKEALYYGRERPRTRQRELAYLVVQTGAAGTLINTASVTSLATDLVPGNDTALESTTVNPSGTGADLSVTKTGSTAASAGGTAQGCPQATQNASPACCRTPERP